MNKVIKMKHPHYLPALLIGTLTAGSTISQAADSVSVGIDQRQSLGITLYNQNLALIREVRDLPPLKSDQVVTIKDVSKQLQPETLRIKNAGTILEQNFNSRLLSQQALLEYYLNKELKLARTNPATGEEVINTVTLLSIAGGQALVARNNSVETIPLNSQWRFIFPSRPDKLLTQPSLTFRSQGTSAPQPAQISYLSSGLSWNMNYVLTLNDKGDRANLSGMATLNNNSGSSYPNTHVQLMAGIVSQVQQPHRLYKSAPREVMAAMADAPSTSPVQMEAFHLYQLPQKVDLDTGQQKQISLINSDKLAIERRFHHEFYVGAHQDSQKHRVKPSLRLSFKNGEKEGLGQPMPAGSIRVFRPDAQGALQFIGGSNLNHKAKNDPVEITLGQAFDLSIQRQQTQFTKTYSGHIVAQEVRVSNAREQPATLVLKANFGQQWEIENSSLPFEVLNSGRAQWTIKVAGKSDQLLNFSVHLKERK